MSQLAEVHVTSDCISLIALQHMRWDMGQWNCEPCIEMQQQLLSHPPSWEHLANSGVKVSYQEGYSISPMILQPLLIDAPDILGLS